MVVEVKKGVKLWETTKRIAYIPCFAEIFVEMYQQHSTEHVSNDCSESDNVYILRTSRERAILVGGMHRQMCGVRMEYTLTLETSPVTHSADPPLRFM